MPPPAARPPRGHGLVGIKIDSDTGGFPKPDSKIDDSLIISGLFHLEKNKNQNPSLVHSLLAV